MTKMLSIVTPCYNEQDNIEEVYRRVKLQIETLGRYEYEHIFIDNASTDATLVNLKRIAAHDKNVKIIVNSRNFGHIRSPMHALLQAKGDATMFVVADLQDPPELIPDLVGKWEEGFSMVLCIKRSSEEAPVMFWFRKTYYAIVERLSSIKTIQNFTGAGLYDRQVVEEMRRFNDPYPFFRGMVAEIGLPYYELLYDQRSRRRGLTKNNFYTLYDMAMLGITNLSKIPLRLVTGFGFLTAVGSLLAGLAYFAYKLIFWTHFTVGIAPLVIGLFFLGAVQLVSMGIIGEYVGAIHTQVQKRPYVTERERINF